MTVKCGGLKRDGSSCAQVAGWGTDHVGEGRCKLHGGASLKGADHPNFKHGRYGKVIPQKIRERLDISADGDPLDILPELELQRALLAEYVSRFDGVNPSAVDISFLMEWLSDIGRMVERITKMRNETALTKAEIAFIAARIPDVLARYIPDPDDQQRALRELFGVTGGVPTGERVPTGIAAANVR